MSTYLENQNWRYATKKYDSSKKISAADLEFLKEAMQLSASSYGLQPYRIVIIENPDLKLKLQPAAYGQSQIVDASHIIVFANKTTVGSTDVDDYMDNIATTRNLPKEALNDFANYMKGNIANMSEENKLIWTAKQTYIALANLLSAAAELKIDATPMEGFDPVQFNEILGLTSLNLNAAVIATVGYRHQDDATQHYKKVRKSSDDLFIKL